MIGEQFDHGDEICGAVVNVRSRQEKISIWTKNASNEAAQVIAVKMNLLFFTFDLTQKTWTIPYYAHFLAAVEHWETMEGVP